MLSWGLRSGAHPAAVCTRVLGACQHPQSGWVTPCPGGQQRPVQARVTDTHSSCPRQGAPELHLARHPEREEGGVPARGCPGR